MAAANLGDSVGRNFRQRMLDTGLLHFFGSLVLETLLYYPNHALIPIFERWYLLIGFHAQLALIRELRDPGNSLCKPVVLLASAAESSGHFYSIDLGELAEVLSASPVKSDVPGLLVVPGLPVVLSIGTEDLCHGSYYVFDSTYLHSGMTLAVLSLLVVQSHGTQDSHHNFHCISDLVYLYAVSGLVCHALWHRRHLKYSSLRNLAHESGPGF